MLPAPADETGERAVPQHHPPLQHREEPPGSEALCDGNVRPAWGA